MQGRSDKERPFSLCLWKFRLSSCLQWDVPFRYNQSVWIPLIVLEDNL